MTNLKHRTWITHENLVKSLPASSIYVEWNIPDSCLTIWGPSKYKDVAGSYQYRDPHVKDKTASRPSYLEHGRTPVKGGLYIEALIPPACISSTEIAMDPTSLIARLMGPTWGPSGADRTQVGPMLAPWTLLSGMLSSYWGITGVLGH